MRPLWSRPSKIGELSMVPVWAKAGAWTEADMVLGGTSRGLGGVFKSIQKYSKGWRPLLETVRV